MELSIVEDTPEKVRLAVRGKVNFREVSPTSDMFSEMLGESIYARPVWLDMSGVDYIDSSGIGWLITCHKRFRQAGGRLVLHSLSPIVSNVMKVLKLERLLEFAGADGCEPQPT